MSTNYQKVWNTMNELETVTSKICSAREILDCAIDAHQEHKHEKVDHLLNAVDEYLQYYLQEFDEKFKDAWAATVGDLRDGDTKSTLQCDKNDPREECKNAWNDFWEEDGVSIVGNPINPACYTAPPSPDRITVNSPKKTWVLPVEADPSGEYFVTFPDDLLDVADLKEGDTIEWVDKGDGSALLKKVEKKTLNYKEAIEAGWEMTGDGFWIPPQKS